MKNYIRILITNYPIMLLIQQLFSKVIGNTNNNTNKTIGIKKCESCNLQW